MASIFLSYRRADSIAWARLIRDALARHLPHVTLFRDIDDIRPGDDFAEIIAQAVGASDVLIALIGPNWAQATGKGGQRRLFEADDFTRIEVATALQRKVRVIPVLVGGAAMPTREELPEDLHKLIGRQNIELSDRAWDDGCRRLAEALSAVLPRDLPAPPPPPPPPPPRRALLVAGGLAGIGAAAGLWVRFGPGHDDEIKRREAAAAAALAASAAAAVKVEPPPPAAPPSLLALDLAGLWQLDVDGKRRQLRITRAGNALVAAVEGVPDPSGEVNWKTAGQLDVTPDQLIFLDTEKRFKVTLIPADGPNGRRWTASVFERRRSEEGLQPVAEGTASVSADGREWAATMKFGEGKTADYFAKLSADGTSVATGMRADGQNRETLNFVRVKP